jgi:hypothetical protein
MLEELSLVDRPANAQAMVSLFKRDDSHEEVMKEQETQEAEATEKAEGCPDCTAEKMCATHEMKKSDAEIALEAEVEKLKADNERLRKGLIEEGYVIKADVIEKKAPVEMMEIEGEMVAKADIPAPVLKALEAAEVAKKQHEIEKADIELTKRAGEALPHFAVDVAKSLLKSFSEEEAIMEALKAADAAFAAAMQEFGKSDVDGEFATAADKLDALVKSHMDTNQMKKSDYAKAYAAVAKTAEGKTLITKTYKGE